MDKELNREIVRIARAQKPEEFRRDLQMPVTEIDTATKLLMLDHIEKLKEIISDLEKCSFCKKQAE